VRPILRATTAAALCVAACAAQAAAATPSLVLGGPWGSGQKGYGKARPATIFNGGDPTGLVEHIRWRHWGAATATAGATASFVWPGQSVATGSTRAKAVVVAFGRRRCHGRRVYQHLVWYFPGYGEKLHRDGAYDLCAKDVYPAVGRDTPCPDVTLRSGAVARSVSVRWMSCAGAANVVAASSAGRYAAAGGRLRSGAFRCGSDGAAASLDGAATFECRLDRSSVLFSITP
jgi:hypothetical protein